MNQNFKDITKELFVIVTVTNWSEPPRIRHEIAYQLSKETNVLFIQVYSQRGKKRNIFQVNDNLIIEKVGISFPGIIRLFYLLPLFRKFYNFILSRLVEYKVKQYGYKNASLINFQFNFPEVMESLVWNKKIYFCNDDFVNQNPNEKSSKVNLLEKIQKDVIDKSDLVITVSKPLAEKLSKYGKNVEIILSGHSFDLKKSLIYEKEKKNSIDVCYMGFLNQYIATDWLEYVLENSHNINITVIGPIAYSSLIERFNRYKNFRHIPFLTGEALQDEMLKHDVMVMPYSSSTDNEVTSVPAKLFQYLAVGKPIVSSNMKNLIKLPEKFVYKASDENEFLNFIKTAYHEDNETLKIARINYSSNHTWDARGEELNKLLQLIKNEESNV